MMYVFGKEVYGSSCIWFKFGNIEMFEKCVCDEWNIENS